MTYHPSHKYIVEVKNRLGILDNIKYLQIFGNDEQIEKNLQKKDEFECANIDIDYDVDNNVDKMMNKVELNDLDKYQEELEILQLKDNFFP